MCDTEQERRDESRDEHKQAIDREPRGVFLCTNCGHESAIVVYCGYAPCGFVGCPECLIFDEAEHNYFCTPECIKKLAIHKGRILLLDENEKKSHPAIHKLLKRTLDLLEIDNSPLKGGRG